MDRTLQQLRRLRRTGRTLLLAQRVMWWGTAVLTAMLLCGASDYLLRLPGWLRFVVGGALVLLFAAWGRRVLREARRFAPSLSTLALRVERLHPPARGRLASAVDFAEHPERVARPERTAELAASAMVAARQALAAQPLRRLIHWQPTARKVLPLAAVIAVMAGAWWMAGRESSLAARRWIAPFGAAVWPTRQLVVADRAPAVAPTDQPLRFAAQVVRGHRPAMRAWLHYRVEGAGGGQGPWRQLLMTPVHVDGERYERVLEFGRDLNVEFGRIVPEPLPETRVSWFVEAGDHRSEPTLVQLVPRPTLRGVVLQITPPDYAAGLIEPVSMTMHDALSSGGDVATATALRGSRIRMRVALNKRVPWSAETMRLALPGLAEVAQVDEATAGGDDPAVVVTFRLAASVETEIKIADAFGFTSPPGRLYRIQSVADTPPRVAIVEPRADEQVLATARVDLRAVARDDVGIASVYLEAALPVDSAAEEETRTVVFNAVNERRDHVESTQRLALGDHALETGDEVVVTAVTRDVYRDGEITHDPVRSSPRRLRVIDPTTMVRQVRASLSNVRQNAEQTVAQQRGGWTDPHPSTQRRITGRISSMAEALAAVRDRIARNELEAPELFALTHQASDITQRAASASSAATAAMQRGEEDVHRAAVRTEQEKVAEALDSLARMLEQGRDVLTLQLTLQRLAREQADTAAETRRLLPHTAGRQPGALDQALADALNAVSKGQRAITGEMAPLLEDMQATAEVLETDTSGGHEPAAAAALRADAGAALRQGLGGTLTSIQKNLEANKLAQAGSGQQQALDVMRQMLEALEQQQHRRAEMLRRRLAELAEAIQRLIRQQEGQRTRVQHAQDLPRLEGSLRTMQANTLTVQRAAAAESALESATAALADAAAAQALAAVAVRRAQRPKTMAQQERALDFLHDALAAVEEQRRAMEEEQRQRQRDALQEAYRALAADQQRLRGEADRLLGVGEPDRRWTVAMRSAANRQGDLRLAAQTLGAKVSDTLLFQSMHDRIDRLGTRATERLRAVSRDRGTLHDQQRIVVTLETMAKALEEEPAEEVFSEGHRSGGGGGGGEASADGASPVSSLAELKLLRGLQEQIHRETSQLHTDMKRDGDDRVEQRRRLQALAEDQASMHEIGARLLEKRSNGARTGHEGPGEAGGLE